MAQKNIRCREHGGIFTLVPRRGRPPVRCSEDNPCTNSVMHGGPSKQATPAHVPRAAEKAATAPRKVSRSERVASGISNRNVDRMAKPREEARRAFAEAESESKPRSQGNANLPMAQAAKAKLEALGWTVKGRAWREAPDTDDAVEAEHLTADMAQVTGARGDETISLTWQDGALVDQSYSLWSEKPSDNGKPNGKLDFNPNEVTDRELVHIISGMKVTWWNSLAKSEEKAIVGTKLTIEHVYDTAANGLETVKRLVKFVDRDAGGFRAFHADALLKVG